MAVFKRDHVSIACLTLRSVRYLLVPETPMFQSFQFLLDVSEFKEDILLDAAANGENKKGFKGFGSYSAIVNDYIADGSHSEVNIEFKTKCHIRKFAKFKDYASLDLVRQNYVIHHFRGGEREREREREGEREGEREMHSGVENGVMKIRSIFPVCACLNVGTLLASRSCHNIHPPTLGRGERGECSCKIPPALSPPWNPTCLHAPNASVNNLFSFDPVLQDGRLEIFSAAEEEIGKVLMVRN